MGKVTMAKSIEIFFRSPDPGIGDRVLQTAQNTLKPYEGTLKLKMERPILKCLVVGDEKQADIAVTAIIEAIKPLVKFVSRQ